METATIGITVNPTQIMTLVWLLLVLIYIVHSVVVSYHWLTFGNSKTESLVGALAHVGVGTFILLSMGGLILL